MVLLEAEGNVVERDRLLTSVWGDIIQNPGHWMCRCAYSQTVGKTGDAGKLIQTIKGFVIN